MKDWNGLVIYWQPETLHARRSLMLGLAKKYVQLWPATLFVNLNQESTVRISLTLSGSTLKLQMLPDTPTTASCILSHPINIYLSLGHSRTSSDLLKALQTTWRAGRGNQPHQCCPSKRKKLGPRNWRAFLLQLPISTAFKDDLSLYRCLGNAGHCKELNQDISKYPSHAEHSLWWCAWFLPLQWGSFTWQQAMITAEFQRKGGKSNVSWKRQWAAALCLMLSREMGLIFIDVFCTSEKYCNCRYQTE